MECTNCRSARTPVAEIGLGLAGCATTGKHVQWYEGAALATNEIALLKVQRDFGGVNVLVHEINGERLDKGAKRLGNTIEIIAIDQGESLSKQRHLRSRWHGHLGLANR